jgi:peptidoglycan/LPS O-acetylase OafA/YrhL
MQSTAETNTQNTVQMNIRRSARTARPHLYELDVLRAFTALAVVAVHVLAFTVIYNTSPLGALIQHGAEATLHYTREVFMFTTALVLVYSYGSSITAGKRFDLKTFWRKRGIGVVVPYAIWSVIYVLSGPHVASPLLLMGQIVVALISGSASFQLYYILLTIQFYVVFPVLLAWLPTLDRYRWRTLAISGGIELIVVALDYHLLQAPPFGTTALGAWLTLAQDRFVLLYQFYFILGALCALHLERVRALALRYGGLIVGASVALLLIYWAHYAYAVGVAHDPVEYAISVLQPIMIPYSIAVIACMWWAACRWASGGARAGVGAQRQPPRGSRFWRTLADASFGIYLVHPMFMALAMTQIIPRLPQVTPEPVRVALVWLVAAGGSALLSVLLMRTPVLSRLVGRNTPLPQPLGERIAAIAPRFDSSLARWRRAAAARTIYARSVAQTLLLGLSDRPQTLGASSPAAAVETSADGGSVSACKEQSL